MLFMKLLSLQTCYLLASAGPPRQQDFKRLHSDLFADYNKDLLPLEVFDKPVRINLTIKIISLNNFDDISGELDMTATLSLKWKEERINWDKMNYSGISSINIPHGNIWRPQIFLVNSAKEITEIGNEGVMVNVESDGETRWSPGQIFKSTCSPNVKYYPFDVQSCNIMFITWSYRSSEVKLEVSNDSLNLGFFSPNPQWEILDNYFKEGLFEGKKYLQYAFTLKRRSKFFVIYLISPIIFLGILNNLVFAMPVSSGERMSVAITAFLSFAVYMGIINDNVPDNSDPMASIFIYLLFLMAHSSMTMIMVVVLLRIYDKSGPVPQPIQVITKCTRFHYWGKRRVSTSNDVSELSGNHSVSSDVFEAKKKCRIDSEEMTWKMVGKTFDGFFFLFGVLLHGCFSLGFFYAIAENIFP